MHLPVLSLRENALLYIAKLITGSIIVWYGLRAFGIAEAIWAMLSLIVVTEPDVTIAKNKISAHALSTPSTAPSSPAWPCWSSGPASWPCW